MVKIQVPTARLSRDTILFVSGLAGIIYETLINGGDKPTLLILFGAMVGLPAFLRADELKKNAVVAPATVPAAIVPEPVPEPVIRKPIRKRIVRKPATKPVAKPATRKKPVPKALVVPARKKRVPREK
jgi:hypothetical protein